MVAERWHVEHITFLTVPLWVANNGAVLLLEICEGINGVFLLEAEFGGPLSDEQDMLVLERDPEERKRHLNRIIYSALFRVPTDTCRCVFTCYCLGLMKTCHGNVDEH